MLGIRINLAPEKERTGETQSVQAVRSLSPDNKVAAIYQQALRNNLIRMRIVAEVDSVFI